MYNLASTIAARAGGFAHFDPWAMTPPGMDRESFLIGAAIRKKVLDVHDLEPPPNKPYTKQLQQAILRATGWNKDVRPTPIQMVRELKRLMKDDSGIDNFG